MSPDQALALHQRELQRHPEVLRRLAERLAATGGDPSVSDPSQDSLVPLWVWFVRWWDAGLWQAAEELPPWFSRSQPDEAPDLTDAMFAVGDELGHYLDEVALRTVPGAHWRVVPEQFGVRVDGFQKSSVMLGEWDFVGVDLGWVMVLRVQRGVNRDDMSLLTVFRRRLEEAGLT